MKDCSDPLSFVDSLLIDPSFLFFFGEDTPVQSLQIVIYNPHPEKMSSPFSINLQLLTLPWRRSSPSLLFRPPFSDALPQVETVMILGYVTGNRSGEYFL